MQVPKFYRLAVMLIAVSFSGFVNAQSPTAEEKNAAIQTIAKNIAANYVFAEKGGQISSHLLTANYRGDFKKASGWDEFDQMVTTTLHKFTGDNHLYVRHDPEMVKQLKSLSHAGDTDQMHVSDEKNANDNYGIKESKVLDGNVGYLKLTSINISDRSLPALYDAMRKLENTDVLIVDLRDNGGGGSERGAVLESYFLPENTPLLEFTTRNGVTKTDSTVNWLTEKKYAKPVYVLVNRNTASAAEALAFVLQQNKRAKIVGENSAGAAFKNDWFVVNDENYVSVSTASPNFPGTELSWEGRGVQPDIKVKNGDSMQYILNKIQKK